MGFEYFDMLSGRPILADGIGYLKSPKLREICPTDGIGFRNYNFILNILMWDKKDILEYDELIGLPGFEVLKNDKLNRFDVLTVVPSTLLLLQESLSFFTINSIKWDEKSRSFIYYSVDDPSKKIGEVNRMNYESAISLIKQLNYIGLEEDKSTNIHHENERSKELWERAQNFLKEQAKKPAEDNPEYHLSNIISKVCAVHPSYNLMNIFDLTVFQLYDTFFQVGYMRSRQITERIFSNYGGEGFNFEDWLKPITKKV